MSRAALGTVALIATRCSTSPRCTSKGLGILYGDQSNNFLVSWLECAGMLPDDTQLLSRFVAANCGPSRGVSGIGSFLTTHRKRVRRNNPFTLRFPSGDVLTKVIKVRNLDHGFPLCIRNNLIILIDIFSRRFIFFR
jgi:hypothetical protein